MKRMLLPLLAAIFLLSACEKDVSIPMETTVASAPTIAAVPTATPAPEPTPEPTLEPTPEPTLEPTPEPAPEATDEPEPSPEPTETPEPDSEPVFEGVSYSAVKESERFGVEFSHIPAKGVPEGMIDGALVPNQGDDADDYKAVVIVQTEEGLYFPKPSLANPTVKVNKGNFTARFYTDRVSDYDVPVIMIIFVEKDYEPLLEIEAGQTWAVSEDSVFAVIEDSELAIKIRR
ncbi:MAG: hypothetical protein LBT59_02155 [Clostridiales bacterium]|jgi:hypothetical protein|nr:hypothetical protein [Clostridiales bacterium]